MGFSKTVKDVRKRLGLSQKQLAEALSVSYATINRWENEHAIPSNLAQKSFFDFCDNNFIDVSLLNEEKKSDKFSSHQHIGRI